MNDDFIYKALPNVQRRFAESLYAKISAQPLVVTPQKRFSRIRNLRWSQATMIILAVLLLVAWSQIHLWIRYVPIGDLWLVEFSLTQPANNMRTVESIPTPGQLATEIIDGQVVMLLPGFDYLSPSWIPERFSATNIPGPG